MKLITKYNKVITEIAEEFAKKFYKEWFWEDDYEYQLMDYKWIYHMIEICDEYFNFDDILMTLEYNIPIKTLRNWYNLSLEASMEWKHYDYNLYNYNLLENGTGKS